MASVEVESTAVVEVKTTHEDAPVVAPAVTTEEVKNEVVEEKPVEDIPIAQETVPVEVGDEEAIETANVAPEAAEEVKVEGLEEKLEDEPVAVPALEEDVKVDQVVEKKPIEEPAALTEEAKVKVVEGKFENVEVKSEVLEEIKRVEKKGWRRIWFYELEGCMCCMMLKISIAVWKRVK